VRWRVAYDLRADTDYLRGIADVTRSGRGISSDPAVVGTDEWWSLVGTDRLPLHSQEGTIGRVFWSGHNDFAEFTLVADDGSRHDWPRWGDHALYVEGLRARIQWIEQRWAAAERGAFGDVIGEVTHLCVRVEVEESDRRSGEQPPHR
jgi:hypothetical protein